MVMFQPTTADIDLTNFICCFYNLLYSSNVKFTLIEVASIITKISCSTYLIQISIDRSFGFHSWRPQLVGFLSYSPSYWINWLPWLLEFVLLETLFYTTGQK